MLERHSGAEPVAPFEAMASRFGGVRYSRSLDFIEERRKIPLEDAAKRRVSVYLLPLLHVLGWTRRREGVVRGYYAERCSFSWTGFGGKAEGHGSGEAVRWTGRAGLITCCGTERRLI